MDTVGEQTHERTTRQIRFSLRVLTSIQVEGEGMMMYDVFVITHFEFHHLITGQEVPDQHPIAEYSSLKQSFSSCFFVATKTLS
jgi:hypothetical protein